MSREGGKQKEQTTSMNPSWGFPAGASHKEPTAKAGRRNRYGFEPWVGNIPWRRAQQPAPVFLPGESHGQRSLED